MTLKKSLRPTILFEDPNLLVLAKPAGLLSQGGDTETPNLVDYLRDYVGRHYIGLIHRLDRNVSGIMVVAKRSKAATRLTKALQENKLKRTYRGWISGKLLKKTKWQHYVIKDKDANTTRVVDKKDLGAKKAVLWARPLDHAAIKRKTVTLAEFTLETGRSHQIRVQSAEEGHPLLGDRKYGSKNSNFVNSSFKRPALHSYQIQFPHPISKKIMTFHADLPNDFKKLI